MHTSQRLLFCLFTCLLGLTACLPLATATAPPPSPTPTASPTATATPVWFPPTATPTPLALSTPSPTPEWLTGIGELIWQDDFSETGGWALLETATNTIAINDNHLTLALAQPKGYLYTVDSSAIFGNFYAEITAETTLCSGGDQFGLLIRFQSPANFYRYGISCDGQVRLDRVLSGAPSSPQPWMFSGNVPAGAPATLRLGVWALGREMRFFVDGQYQFTVRDPSIPSGAIGVFVRAAGETAVTARFYDLKVYALQP